MPRKQPSGLTRFFRDFIRKTFSGPVRSNERKSKRRLKFESLEGRQLLASDLASLTGIVSLGGTPIDGATVNLYLDDGDSVFDPGAGQDGTATQTLTAGGGIYRFDKLVAGNYWIEQPDQTVGTDELGQFVSSLITILAAQADGTAGTVIDDFNDSPLATVAATTGSNSLVADHPEALNGERDMTVTLKSGTTAPQVSLTSTLNELVFSSSIDAQGLFSVIYDGDDGDANVLDATGLAPRDLTQGGVNTAIKVRAEADQAGATVRLRVYTNATNYSDLELTIPSGSVPEDLVFHFADFTLGAGAAGVANFANVGAIDVLIETNTDATDGIVTVLGAFAPIAATQNITNEADLSLTKTVDDDTPLVGQEVTFTLTLTNTAGGAGATGVTVNDLLPAGLDFASATPSGTTTYDENTGVWTVGSLAAGASATLEIVATVTAGASIDNTATIATADQTDPDLTDNAATETVDAVPTANLSLTKTVDDESPNLNQEVTFTLTLNNAGPDGATGVVVTDLLPAGLDFVSATPSGSTTYDDATGIWTIGAVASGGNATLTIVATAISTSPVINTAEVTAAGEADPNSTPNNDEEAEDDQESVTIDAVGADLSVTKTVDDDAPAIGQEVTFTVTVSNAAGGDDASGVVVTDLLPAGLDFVSATPSGSTTYDEGTGVWTVGAISAGASATLTIVAAVTGSAAIDNTATITAADQFDPDTADNAATETVDAVATANLSLTKTVDDESPNLNQEVTFTLTLSNAGPDGATGVVVTDLLPAGFDFESATPSGTTTYDDATGIWTIGAVASGGNATLTIVATVISAAALDNTAEVTAVNEADPNSTPNNNVPTEDDQDSASVNVVATDLSLTKTVDDDTPAVGQEVTFTITVSNPAGDDNATGVVVTDELPAGLTFVSATPSGTGTYDDETGIWTIGAIAAGTSATLQIVATVTGSAAIDNTATITAADQADPATANNTATETVDAVATADLSLTNTVNNPTPALNSQVTFTLTLTNGGPDAATGVVVTDLLPAGLTFVSATPSGTTTYTAGTGVWNVGTVNSGANATLSIVATVTSSTAINNVAQVTAAGEADPDSTPGNNVEAEDDQETATVDAAAADLSLTKTVNNAAPNLGQQVTFTLTLTNGGPDSATGVVVTDLLPAGLTFVSATPSGTSTYNQTTGVWNVGTVTNTTPATLSIVATVTSAAAITNTAQVTASGTFDPDSTPNDGQGDDFDTEVVDAVDAAVADLSLTKTVSNAAPALNSQVTFTLTLANAGPNAATGVVVTDLLPAGLTFVSATPSGTSTYNQTTGVWDIGTVNSAANATLSIVATVTSAAAITNSAQVTASGVFDPDSTPNDGQGDDFDSEAVDAIDPAASADLSLTKTASSTTPAVNSNVTFTLTLTNSGPDSATGVVVTDLLPAGLTFVSATPSGTSTYNQTTGIWNVGTVATGTPATLLIVAQVTSSAAIVNTAQVTAATSADPDSTPNDNTGDDRATITIDAAASADLSVTMTPSSTTPNFGANVTFTIVVSNAGPDAATGVVVTDLLPAGLVFVSSTRSQGTYVAGTGVWTVGTINSGSTATMTLVARVNTTAAVDNVAQVTASGAADPDSTPGDNTGDDRALVTIDAAAAADLRLAKTVSQALVNVGENVTFRLTLTNGGPDTATGVSVTDLLAAGLTFVSATASQGTYDSTTGIWTVGDVTNGAAPTLDIVATLATAGGKTNTAQVTASGTFDPDSTPNDNTGDDRATVSVGTIRLSKRSFLARPH